MRPVRPVGDGSMNWHIRAAVPSDYTDLCALFEEVDALHRAHLPSIFQQPAGPARSEDHILGLIADPSAGLFVAQVGGRLVGLVCVLVREPPEIPLFVRRRYAVIDTLVVQEAFRRAGIGRALMGQAHAWAVAQGAECIELGVWEFNQGAIDFYRALGYETAMRRMSVRLCAGPQSAGGPMDVREHNRLAWDRQVEGGNPWTIPVGPEEIAAARAGQWTIYLTPTKPVPHDWLPDLAGSQVLCLASGGGQQGPVLAAAGAQVTVLDNSPRQLERDRLVAEREGLAIVTVEGDMADLHVFPDGRFDIIVHPVSNVFVPDVRPVWREARRVLRRGGILIAGFDNPIVHAFDYADIARTGRLEVKYALPYSDLEQLSEAEKERYREEGIPFEFGHTLEDQIGGQIAAGFVITGFYEDHDREGEDSPLRDYMPSYIATRARAP